MTEPESTSAGQLIDRFETARRPFRALVQELSEAGKLDELTVSGWTTKEMLGHVAFWEECVEPVVRGRIRQEIPIDTWQFGSGFVPGNDEWPHFDVHNAREAAWAKVQTADAVLARWDAAHAGAVAALATVTDAEAIEQATYFGEVIGHIDEHHAELRAVLPPR